MKWYLVGKNWRQDPKIIKFNQTFRLRSEPLLVIFIKIEKIQKKVDANFTFLEIIIALKHIIQKNSTRTKGLLKFISLV